jgi:NTP-dependent ternary system trypsin peptidase co-occuring protein
MKKIALAEVLVMVREELNKANDDAMKSGRPVMLFDECELEFAVDVEFNVEAKTSYLSFLSLKGGAKRSDSNTIKVKFKALSTVGVVAIAQNDAQAGPAPGKRLSTKQ